MSSVQTSPEYASRAARLDRILAELLEQTPGVEAAAVVSFDGLPMASALPVGMDEDRIAAMSAALLSLAERASQDLTRGLLSQVYIEGEHGSVFLVSAKDEAVLIAVTAAGAKVGMMLYEVKLAATKVGEALKGPLLLPTPLPSHLNGNHVAPEPAFAEPVAPQATDEQPADIDEPDVELVVVEMVDGEIVDVEVVDIDFVTVEPVAVEPVDDYDEQAAEPAEIEPSEPFVPADAEPAHVEPASAAAEPEYADADLGSPLYDQVAYGQVEGSDYYVVVPSAGDAAATFDDSTADQLAQAEPAQSTELDTPAAQTWYADQVVPVERREFPRWNAHTATYVPAESPAPEATAESNGAASDSEWSPYAPSATVLPGEPTAWS